MATDISADILKLLELLGKGAIPQPQMPRGWELIPDWLDRGPIYSFDVVKDSKDQSTEVQMDITANKAEAFFCLEICSVIKQGSDPLFKQKKIERN